MSDTILDHFESADDFEDTLLRAELKAKGQRDQDFVESIRDKFDEYGERMFLSDAQNLWLSDIAER